MYEVSPKLYGEIAERIYMRLGGEDYFSERIEFSFGEVECTLLTSFMVYRRWEEDDNGAMLDLLDDAVPVWWEFHTDTPDGEVCNDFSFDILNTYLRQ